MFLTVLAHVAALLAAFALGWIVCGVLKDWKWNQLCTEQRHEFWEQQVAAQRGGVN
jgi:hypothetical protein